MVNNKSYYIGTRAKWDEINNVLGQNVRFNSKPGKSEALNVSDLSPGIYIITFVSEDGIWSSEFVKE